MVTITLHWTAWLGIACCVLSVFFDVIRTLARTQQGER